MARGGGSYQTRRSLEVADVGERVGVDLTHVVVVTRPVEADAILVGEVEVAADTVGDAVFIAADAYDWIRQREGSRAFGPATES